MTKRIFRSISIVALAVFCASMFLIMGMLYDYFSTIQKNQLRSQTMLAAQGVTHEGKQYFDLLDIEEGRITWVSPDGTVLYDNRTDVGEMENHLSREEIREALETGYGESERFSSTLMHRSLYCAQRLDDGSVIRMSVAQNTIFMLLLGMLHPICVTVIIAIVLSLILASRLAKKIVEPLNRLNLDNPLANDGYDELSPLLRRLDLQQHELARQRNNAKRKADEFAAITGSMSEGLVLLNNSGTVLSINPAAAKLLNTNHSCIGQDILEINRSTDLQRLIKKALSGNEAEDVLCLTYGDYQVNVSPVISEDAVSGAVILMFNVTEKEGAEKMRREFTANVSHELKTPLHSISGYAELMKNGMVRPEDIGSFSGKIYSEAQRMIRLVDDIIRLSRLDEGVSGETPEPVDIFALADEVVRTLEPAASLADVEISISGEPIRISGFPQHIRGMVYNLCDNAIKYNRPKGTVHVEVTDCGTGAAISVQDTGIGIPPEHHSRIFERFYSVDRSHSKEIGGTGLGLSIVKHAAKIHNAKIELESEIDVGTVITVYFPK